MAFFASKEVEENVARLIAAYSTATLERGFVPIDSFPEIHDCAKRGCVYVIKAQETDSEPAIVGRERARHCR